MDKQVATRCGTALAHHWVVSDVFIPLRSAVPRCSPPDETSIFSLLESELLVLFLLAFASSKRNRTRSLFASVLGCSGCFMGDSDQGRAVACWGRQHFDH
jgi:hypothetical protein